ncbi:hypothetical protein [Mycobacterium lehmannii]|uniref:hypothetical protein n=1 Tax=Mycobacterium lehmannii TaxID=2048550 RepID=UPI0013F4F8DC|nr:hypothetical protein [Mycobacterium lehmannii]
MSTAVVVITVSLVAVILVGAAVILLVASRVGQRRGESAGDRYRREMGNLHSLRNRRMTKAQRRRKRWAAGTAAAAGLGYTDSGGGWDGGGCGGGGCGGGGCGGGGA